MNNIPISEPYFNNDELRNVIEAVKSGWVSSKGRFIPLFEEKFAEYCNRKFGVATSNGTTALHLALSALGIKNGDEVIVTNLTFIAPANAVAYCGAKPVFVDSNEDYWCIDPEKIEEKITKRTKAIIPVHLYGHPCDMDKIIKIAKKYKLYIIEDAAEAHGAEYNGKKIGSFGDISCFSFFGNKNMTTGEGGICLTDNEDLRNKMKMLRDHGMNPEKRYWHDSIGFNYRMTNIQAAIGLAQLKKLNKFINKKKKIANLYKKEFSELESKGILTLHPKMPFANNVVWMYSILINKNIDRDGLMKKLSNRGIDTRPFFYPLTLMPPYKSKESFPVAEKLSKKGLNLPSSVKLNETQIKFIARSIKELI